MRFLTRVHTKIFKYKEGIAFYSQSIAALLLATMSIIVSIVAIYVSRQQMLIANKAYELEVAKTSPYFKVEKVFFKDDFNGEIDIRMENSSGLAGIDSVIVETVAGVMTKDRFCFWRVFQNFYDFQNANIEKSQPVVGVYDRAKSVNVKYASFRKNNVNAFSINDMQNNLSSSAVIFYNEISKWIEMTYQKQKDDYTFIVENTYLNIEYFDQFGRRKYKNFNYVTDKLLLELDSDMVLATKKNFEAKKIGAVVLTADSYKLVSSPSCQEIQK